MTLKRKVTGVEEMDFGIGNIASEGLNPTRQEKRANSRPEKWQPRSERRACTAN